MYTYILYSRILVCRNTSYAVYPTVYTVHLLELALLAQQFILCLEHLNASTGKCLEGIVGTADGGERIIPRTGGTQKTEPDLVS